MTRWIICLLLLTSPAMAEQDLLKNRVPDIRTLSVDRLPGTQNRVIQYTTTECGPPAQLLGRHKDELQRLDFKGQPIRVLPPGTMKTMDFNPKRINFGVDDRGIIRAISCG